MEADWAELQKDVLEEILSRLYGGDVMSFQTVCRNWHATNKYVFEKEHNPLVFPEPQSQWLLHKQYLESSYQFLHLVYPNIRYTKNIPQELELELNDAVPRYSKDGWLLMSRGQYSVFFFSPFSEKLIELPDHLPLYFEYEADSISVSCAPTSTSCVVFSISCFMKTEVTISAIRIGRSEWKANYHDNNIPFRPAYCNPVYHKQVFYCLSLEGKLGVYDYHKDTWIVLEKPESPCKRSSEKYLVEHEGGLMSMFMGESGSWLSIFKLNESDMIWENVYTLGDYALFVSMPTSFATKSVLGTMKNKIFFPLLHNNYLVFYSLQTKAFCTYGSNLSVSNLYTTEIAEQLESCWIEPREICCGVVEEEMTDPLIETTDEDSDIDAAASDKTDEDEDTETDTTDKEAETDGRYDTTDKRR